MPRASEDQDVYNTSSFSNAVRYSIDSDWQG